MYMYAYDWYNKLQVRDLSQKLYLAVYKDYLFNAQKGSMNFSYLTLFL